MLHNNKMKIIVSMSMLMMLTACGGSMSDLQSFVDNAFKDNKPEIEPLPVVPPYKAFSYVANEELDPFSADNIIGGAGAAGDGGVALGKPPVEDRPKEELENFPLDALSMVGTLTKKNQPWVVIKTSQGTVLFATVGNYVGENYGKIKRISTEEQVVVLTETVTDPSGRWITRDVEITVDEQ